jgi:hypothetical protein
VIRNPIETGVLSSGFFVGILFSERIDRDVKETRIQGLGFKL